VKGFSEAIHAVMQDSQEVLVVDYSGERPIARIRPKEDFPEVEKVPIRHVATVGARGQTVVEMLNEPVIVCAEPVLEEELSYSARTPVTDDGMYPPSSFGWYGRMAADQTRVRFIVQRIDDDDKYWLTIMDPETMEVYESHHIYAFEVAPLQVKDATEYLIPYVSDSEAPYVGEDEEKRRDALTILDEPSPNWEQLWHLTKGFSVNRLRLGESMRDTLTHLIPTEWPERAREDYMALLAWTLGEVPYDEDPVDLHESWIHTPTLCHLLSSHYIREVLGIHHPDYVSEINNPPTSVGGTPMHEPGHQPWVLLQEKLTYYGLMPSHASEIAAGWSRKLNESGKVWTGLPVTRAMARKSRKHWVERIVLQHFMMGVQTRPRARALGLRSLVYIGSAHRWPHKHMAWKATLGVRGTTPLHIQEVLIPASQIEAIRRVRSGLRECVWYFRAFNSTTEVDRNRFFRIANRPRTLGQLKREFGYWKKKTPYTPSELDVRVIDGSSDGVHLSDLEKPTVMNHYGFTAREYHRSLQRLTSEGVVSVMYRGIERPYPVRLITITGEEGHVLGFARAALQHTPISSVYVLEDGSAVIVTNMPSDQIDGVCSEMNAWAAERDIDMGIFTIGAFLNLRRTLMKRLWKGDRWDEDISAMTSQVRRKPLRADRKK
jgi:hypothetical protein